MSKKSERLSNISYITFHRQSSILFPCMCNDNTFWRSVPSVFIRAIVCRINGQ